MGTPPDAISPALRMAVGFLARLQSAAVSVLGEGWAITFVLRHRSDPKAHWMLGDDKLPELQQCLVELEANATLEGKAASLMRTPEGNA